MVENRASQILGHLRHPHGFFDGQTVIITGAGQGIGAEIARQFAAEGARVVVSDIDQEKANAVAADINAAFAGRALAVAGDITDSSSTDTLVKKAATFGDGKLHHIVNNAGYTWDAVIHKTSDKQWESMIAVHSTAPFRIIRAAAPYFRVSDGEQRSIINISSASGIHGAAGQVNYATAKASLVGLSKTICKEWGPKFGVRANTISFGAVETRLTKGKELNNTIKLADGTEVVLGIPGATQKSAANNRYADTPLQRAAAPSEAASAVLALASPLMSYVSGQTIEVTGGKWI